MHAFAVLIFWFLLGRRKLKSELLETLSHTFPHIFRLTTTSRKEVSIISSPQRETATTLISVSMHGMRRSTLTLQESFNDLVQVLSPSYTIKTKQTLLGYSILFGEQGTAALHCCLPNFLVVYKEEPIQIKAHMSFTCC